MAIYRADKAVMSFGTEAAQGGIPEGATTVSDATGSARIKSHSGLPAGSRSISVMSLSSLTAGEHIQIGPEVGGSGTVREAEVRTIEFVEGTDIIHLNAPTAFFHPYNTNIQVISAVTDKDEDKFMTFTPGVYEGIDVPDPEMNIDPKYLLGTSSNRNFYAAYKSSQTYTGGVGTFTLLNGWPLRFPIGKITSIAKASSSPLTATTYLTADAKKGDYWISLNSATNFVANDIIAIDPETTPTSSDVCELRRVVDKTSNDVRLNYPLHFDHTGAGSGTAQIQEVDETAAGLYYQHDIWETTDLDTVSWNVLLRDSAGTAANDIIRRYYGGKIGSASIAATEEGMLTMSWDSVPFLGMSHNQSKTNIRVLNTKVNTASEAYELLAEDLDDSETGVNVDDGDSFTVNDVIRIDDEHMLVTGISTDTLTVTRAYNSTTAAEHNDDTAIHIVKDVPGAGLVQTIDDTDLARTIDTNISSYSLRDRSYPQTNPYFFSNGTVSIFGRTFARVSDFNMSIDNSIESRYYINTRYGKLNRGPTETREGARSYTMSATLALPDTSAATSSDVTLFKELLLEGDYGTTTVPDHSGFNITLTFTRGTNDDITFTIPSDGISAKGGNQQGAFITSATHNVGGSGILSVDVNMIFRNMKIQINDSALLYP